MRSVVFSQLPNHSFAGTSEKFISDWVGRSCDGRTRIEVRVDDAVQCNTSNAVGEHIDEIRANNCPIRRWRRESGYAAKIRETLTYGPKSFCKIVSTRLHTLTTDAHQGIFPFQRCRHKIDVAHNSGCAHIWNVVCAGLTETDFELCLAERKPVAHLRANDSPVLRRCWVAMRWVETLAEDCSLSEQLGVSDGVEARERRSAGGVNTQSVVQTTAYFVKPLPRGSNAKMS